MDQHATSRDLRVCPTCWSVVHVTELGEHDSWHERVTREAVAEAKRQLSTERRTRLGRLVPATGYGVDAIAAG